MKRIALLFLATIILISIAGNAQAVTDSLDIEWEASVNYGNSGQTTVFLNDTLWHFGAVFYYGTPFNVGRFDNSYVEYMALSDNSWVIDTLKTLYRMHGNTEVSGDNIYLFGGYGNSEALEIFHPASKSLTRGADLPNPRRYGGSGVFNGKIYLVGGADNDGYSDKLDIYDIAANSWSSGAPLPVATQTDAVIKDGKIYTMGGYNGGVLDAIYEYDIAGDSWSQIGTVPEPTSAHSMAVFSDYIYVFGDFADLNRVMRYTVSDSSWVNYESDIIGRRHASITIANDKLYYVAGNANRSNGTYQRFRIVQSIGLTAAPTSLAPEQVIPEEQTLKQNFPNPFNPSTLIQFSLENPTTVQIYIYNIRGQVVRELRDEFFNEGRHELSWDGRDNEGRLLPSGQYVYRMKTNTNVTSKKMIMLR